MKILRALLAVSVVTVLFAPAAGAEPEPPPPEPAPAVSLRQLGLNEQLVVRAAEQPAELVVPTPPGTTLGVLNGQVDSVVNVVNGRVDILDDAGTFLASIAAPVGNAVGPFSVDVSRARIVSGEARLRFVLRDERDGAGLNACTTVPELTLDQMAVSYGGESPNPELISDFLPGYLSRIVLRVGPDPGPEIQQAALELTSQLTSLYQPLPVRIEVDDSGSPPSPAGADTRVIELSQAPQPSITVRDPGTPNATLVLAGSGHALRDQIDVFVDRRAEVLQTSTATVTSVTPATPKSSRVMTFGELKMASQTSVLGASTLYTGFDLSSFGVGSVEAAEVRMLADYTPVVGGDASIVVRSGSTALASAPLDTSGKLNLTFTVPGDLIQSQTGLAMDIQYAPRQQCAPLSDRLTFTLNPTSTVSVTPGTRNRGGFPSLPMAFTPEVSVALGSPNLLRYAVAALNLMGQQARFPLRPVVRAFDEAVGSTSPLLVVADHAKLAAANLGAPLQPGDGTSLTVNAEPSAAIDTDANLGTVQAFTTDARPVLVVSADGDWSQVVRTFDYIWAQPDRWSSISGDVLATGRQATVNLTMREGGSMAPLPTPAEGWRWWAWVTIGVAAAAVLAVAATLLVRRRHRDRVG